MGADDDLDCPHIWGPDELHLTLQGADVVSTCDLCGAVRYEPSESASDPYRRPL